MNAPVSPAILLDAIKREREYRAAEGSLIAFTQQAFHVIEPGVAFRDNWHLHAISEHLEAVSEGQIQNLIINIPPGCMKSILVSVSWPAWEWIENPALRYLGASYGADLAIRDSWKCRDIILSDWYQARWPHIKIRKGVDQKLKYELETSGWRMATSVGGRATGEHPDRKIIDDPHNAKQAESDTEREGALLWFDRTLSTRGESRGARTVVVMQRLHEKDVTGHILADIGGYTHLCLPMEYDGVRRTTSVGWTDPRKEVGDLLWPEMFPTESVAKLKRLLGEYGTSGQLQQQPSPPGGGILKTKHFQLWRREWELPQFDFVLQSYDTAFTEKTSGDPTGCEAWGFFTWKGRKCVLLLDAWDEHLSYPELKKRAIENWNARYGKSTGQYKGRKPDLILVEAKGSGQSLIQDLQTANIGVAGYNPGTQDKLVRAHIAAPYLEMDIFFIPESKKEPGEFVTWARPAVTQIGKFPNAEHDEYVDTFTQMVIYAKDARLLEIEAAPDDEVEEVDYHALKQKKRNPYS